MFNENEIPVAVGYSIWVTDEIGKLELWKMTNRDNRVMLQEFREVQKVFPGRRYVVTEDFSDGTRSVIINK